MAKQTIKIDNLKDDSQFRRPSWIDKTEKPVSYTIYSDRMLPGLKNTPSEINIIKTVPTLKEAVTVVLQRKLANPDLSVYIVVSYSDGSSFPIDLSITAEM